MLQQIYTALCFRMKSVSTLILPEPVINIGVIQTLHCAQCRHQGSWTFSLSRHQVEIEKLDFVWADVECNNIMYLFE